MALMASPGRCHCTFEIWDKKHRRTQQRMMGEMSRCHVRRRKHIRNRGADSQGEARGSLDHEGGGLWGKRGTSAQGPPMGKLLGKGGAEPVRHRAAAGCQPSTARLPSQSGTPLPACNSKLTCHHHSFASSNIESFRPRPLETDPIYDTSTTALQSRHAGSTGKTACGIYGANSATTTLKPASGLN